MSAIYDAAAALYAECRAEFELYLCSAVDAAESATSGYMTNPDGQRAGHDGWSLFTVNRATTARYASDELREYLHRHPRMTFAEFERAWFAGRQL